MDTEQTGMNNFLTPVEPAPVVPSVSTPQPNQNIIRSDLFSNPSYRFTPPKALSADDLRSNPQTMEDIREYMTRRNGVHIQEYSDDDLYDAFINHMRSFNVNEVTTVGEALWARRADDETKAFAARAYEHFDSLGSVFTNDGIGGAFDGVKDYAISLAFSPSTYLGGIIGRASTAPARAAAAQSAKQVVRTALENRAAAAAGDVATQTALQTAETQARTMLTQAARQAAAKEVAIAAGVDAATAAGQDAIYQLTLMNVGAQDGYSIRQTLLNTATGLVGAIPPSLSYIARQEKAIDIAVRSTIIAQRQAEEALQRARPEIEEALKVFEGQTIDWLKSVSEGRQLVGNDYDLANRSIRILLDPDPANRASIVGAMQRAGVGIKRGDPQARVVEQIASFARNISPEAKAPLNDLFRKHLNGLDFDQFTDIMVSAVSQSGTNLKLAKDAADALTKVFAARTLADDTIIGLSETARRNMVKNLTEETPPEVVRYVQSVWRRALVSHPATTAVNVAGWAQVEAFKGVAEILNSAALLGAGGLTKLISPVSRKAGEWADKAVFDAMSLLRSQVFKMKTLMSPNSTKEIFDAMLEQTTPKNRRKIDSSLFGGVDGTMEAYNIRPDNKVAKGVENVLDKAGTISLLKVQDVYTKSMSFVFELDKQLRLMGQGKLSDVLDHGDLSAIPPEAFDKAIEATLKSTMSMDYTKAKGLLGAVSRLTETISNTPYIGFLFPFGRFMNNQLAFVLEYSPLAFLSIAGKMRQKGFLNSPDVMEDTAKAMVGFSAMAYLYHYQQEQQENGYTWYEVADRTGTVYNVQNVAPISAYLAAARYLGAVASGQVTPELESELVDQLGSLSMMNTIDSNPIGAVSQYINSIRNDEKELKVAADILNGLAGYVSGIAAGFTRPIEPLDVVMGLAANSDYAVDRRQLSGIEAAYRNTTRYVENIFAMFTSQLTGERRDVNPVRQDATKFGPVRDPNPMSRMFGFREQMSATDIDRLLNMVNIPSWTIQERSGIPEWDSLMNEYITPRLNARAKALMNNPVFKTGNASTRERLVRELLQEVRNETISYVERQLGTDENLLLARQRFIRKPQSLRRQAMSDLNITTNERELSFLEIEQLLHYIDILQEQENFTVRN